MIIINFHGVFNTSRKEAAGKLIKEGEFVPPTEKTIK